MRILLSRANFWMVWRWHGISYFQCYFFCLEPTVKRTLGWERSFLKVLLKKLLDISYVQSSLSTFTRHTDNGIWKTSWSWRFYSNGSTYVLILPWWIARNENGQKVPGKLSVVQKSEPVLWRAFHLLLYSSFSLKQT